MCSQLKRNHPELPQRIDAPIEGMPQVAGNAGAQSVDQNATEEVCRARNANKETNYE